MENFRNYNIIYIFLLFKEIIYYLFKEIIKKI